MKGTKIVGLLFVIIALVSCRRDLEKPSWDVKVLTPLINSELDINNIITDTLLVAETDSSLKMVYQTDLYNYTVDSLLKIPDTTNVNAIRGLFAPFTALLPKQSLYNITKDVAYNLKGIELTDAKIKSGFVHILIRNAIRGPFPVEVTYKINSAKKNNVPFQLVRNIPTAKNGVPYVYDTLCDMSDYVIDLRGGNGLQVNNLSTVSSARIAPSASQTEYDSLMYLDSLIVSGASVNIVPSYGKGYFSKTTLNIGPSTIPFTLFNRIKAGSLSLDKMTFTLTVTNSVGVDEKAYITEIYSKNSKTGKKVYLTGSIINSPINISRAIDNGGVVTPTVKVLTLNTSNSNIKALVENLPDTLGYAMKIYTNPLGNISGSNDFMYIDKTINASLDLQIPLSLSTTDLTLEDTLSLDLSSLKDKLSATSGYLYLYADNGFPFDAKVQLYMLNASQQVTDSLVSPGNLIYAANLDGNYKVVSQHTSKLIINLPPSKRDKLLEAKKLLVRTAFSTASNPNYVKLYSNYKIKFQLVADADHLLKIK